MHPKDLKIENFTYDLPNEKIAYAPVDPRDSSKILLYQNGTISQDIYRNISDHLPEDAVLVFNDTKVIKSRIFFQRPTGAVIEVFCLEPYGENSNYEDFFQQKGSALWTCLVGKIGKWKEKQLSKTILVNDKEVLLSVEIVDKLTDSYVIKFTWTPEEIAFGEIIDHAGVTPLPPYIKRIADKKDEETYQTVYSEHEGSVAAPTAGLHFTPAIFEKLKEKNIPSLFTTLHVGAGTFMPVKSDTMEGHHMHSEYMNITLAFLDQLYNSLDKTVISVGTTSTRTLESIFWMGNKIINCPEISYEDLKVSQWEPYETENISEAKDAVKALYGWIQKQGLDHISIETEIIIAPSYTYKIVKGLVTNFHQPQSTLLLLVSALIGEEWHKIYDYALQNDFRFLSYGDGSLLLP
ncbi:S-adenosylmethionine:tRNA ribosyltransferase-isomerase [Elizabethkingia sp. JS20170427COW]|uniref:S-adenosylmethionine:tRNA ribosyltransferase-isomerase n=1 Tax=Elizabethkingia sp. JS20170427COW TaxID=2583851 RepID=UPI0011109BA3|nr:S-adenosylmethionine:tRNA ribosyltransferase-isomerase [Elizabethkingia sp. JS20170427COW]QCX52744.1 S-adenosylmethionine:tRNA ribosyltransferase-isomerase [Elizabethkingia sp. JS20170427COW]